MFQRLADGIFSIAGAAGLSQFPEFFQQYIQRLGGRLDQAVVQKERIAAAARGHGLAVDEYARRLLDSADAVARSEGHNVVAALGDADRLRAAYDALIAANLLERPIVLARHFDEALARATLDQFVPAVPLSPESLAYAAVGMLIGLIVLSGCERCVRATGRIVRGRA